MSRRSRYHFVGPFGTFTLCTKAGNASWATCAVHRARAIHLSNVVRADLTELHRRLHFSHCGLGVNVTGITHSVRRPVVVLNHSFTSSAMRGRSSIEPITVGGVWCLAGKTPLDQSSLGCKARPACRFSLHRRVVHRAWWSIDPTGGPCDPTRQAPFECGDGTFEIVCALFGVVPFRSWRRSSQALESIRR